MLHHRTWNVTVPAAFEGTPAERAANVETHDFDPQAGRCTGCDCRPWGDTAGWPCGTEVPRRTL